MIVLGIDPGTAIMGYGVIDYQNSKHKPLAYGVLRTSKDDAAEYRLERLFYGVSELLEKHQPDIMAVEELFFNQNVTTAITVGQARGVALLAASMKKVKVTEYTPLQVKQAVVGLSLIHISIPVRIWTPLPICFPEGGAWTGCPRSAFGAAPLSLTAAWLLREGAQESSHIISNDRN